jgi:transposase-like protein
LGPQTKNVLNKLPKSLQAHAKDHIHAIWMAPTREEAEAAFDYFITAYDAKYPKAVECLTKDREELLVFYDFPGDHWRHLRTTNPIESTFATIRLRTAKTRGCLSRKTALAMVYKLALSAQRGWRRLNSSELLTDVVGGVTFKDGVKITQEAA